MPEDIKKESLFIQSFERVQEIRDIMTQRGVSPQRVSDDESGPVLEEELGLDYGEVSEGVFEVLSWYVQRVYPEWYKHPTQYEHELVGLKTCLLLGFLIGTVRERKAREE